MAEQRQREIVVGEATHDWSDEMVAQWTVLANTIARTVRQETKLQEDHGKRKRAVLEQEIERLRAALSKSEQSVEAATAEAREATDRLGAMQRHFEMKEASLGRELERELERRGPVSAAADRHLDEEAFSSVASRAEEPIEEGSPAARAHQEPSQEAILQWALKQQRSSLSQVGKVLSVQWARLRARPLLLPITGFLAGLLVMVALYPLLHRAPVQAAKGASFPQAAQRELRAPVTPGRTDAPATTVSSASSTATIASVREETAAAAPEAPTADAGVNDYAVLLAGGKTLTAAGKGEPSAAYEAQLAMQAGYPTLIYQKNGRYTAAVPWDSRDRAEESMKLIQAPYNGRWVRTSAIVKMSQWCPVKTILEPVVIRNTDVSVLSCDAGSSIPRVNK